MSRLQRPCRQGGAGSGAVGEELRLAIELRRCGECSRLVRTLADKTQKVDAITSLHGAPHCRFFAEDARDRALGPKGRYRCATAPAPKATWTRSWTSPPFMNVRKSTSIA